MTVELSVGDVREALCRVAPPSAVGEGEPANLLLGKIFHEVFAELVGIDPDRSGLRLLAESTSAGPDRARELAQRTRRLLDHTWTAILAPRILRHRAYLGAATAEVMMLWRATGALVAWIDGIVTELAEHDPASRGDWRRLGAALRAEVPLACELQRPGWREPVRLHGIADAVLWLPGRRIFSAIELKLGRAKPVVDLGQAALYRLMIARGAAARASDATSRTPDDSRSALVLVRFSPERDEQVARGGDLDHAEGRLLDLIGKLAGVQSPGSAASRVAPPVPPSAPAHEELGKRLVRAYREHGVGIELAGPPLVGPRFLRFAVRLGAGVLVDKLRRRTEEVRARLELATEPLVIQEAGRLWLDVARPDPEIVSFASIEAQLPPIDPLRGSALLPIGVDPAGRLHFADLGSASRSHVLVAGTTGSGKSEWLRTAIAGLLASNTPETLGLVTMDPKLAAFRDLEASPFLWTEESYWIPGSARPATELLSDLIDEMDRRYALAHEVDVDNLTEYVERTGRPLRRIVCVCDEYFALVSQSAADKREIERCVALLGAKGRAAGVHLVLATQQPSRRIIQGPIDTNLPCRVALALTRAIESQMILGVSGAERLTGKGDLLYLDSGALVRLQAPYLSQSERQARLRA